jgi:uncharacterized protein (TIGR03067 family)
MPQDIDLLQGSWSITSLLMEGQELPASLFANASMVKGNRFTSLGIGTEYGGTLTLDSSTNPRQLNMNLTLALKKATSTSASTKSPATSGNFVSPQEALFVPPHLFPHLAVASR